MIGKRKTMTVSFWKSLYEAGYKKIARVGAKLLAYTALTACIVLSVGMAVGLFAFCRWALCF